MKSKYEYLSIVLNVKTRIDRDGCFSLPANLCNLFDLKPNDEVHLIIENKDGHKFNGKRKLNIHYEICSDDLSIIVKAGEMIKVTIFNE